MGPDGLGTTWMKRELPRDIVFFLISRHVDCSRQVEYQEIFEIFGLEQECGLKQHVQISCRSKETAVFCSRG